MKVTAEVIRGVIHSAHSGRVGAIAKTNMFGTFVFHEMDIFSYVENSRLRPGLICQSHALLSLSRYKHVCKCYTFAHRPSNVVSRLTH